MKWLTAAVVIPLIAIVTITPAAMAQTAGQISVGLLSLHSAEHEKAGNIGATAFRAGMQALGYSEGQNFHLHERHAEGDAALTLFSDCRAFDEACRCYRRGGN